MEKKVINRFYHGHTLILKENVSGEKPLNCYGCANLVTNLEAAYVCTRQYCRNRDRTILHRRCGELASEILHPKHPQHPIPLFDYHNYSGQPWCDICLRDLGMVLGYRCSSCNFDIDIACAQILQVEGKRQLQHPSHPDHPLTLMRKPAFAFCCDGCGAQDVDMAYICSTCEFWVHKTCASLPLILPTNRQYHHHDLSLAFSFPTQHRRYIFNCDVCDKRLSRTCWVYFCGDCRFYAHLNCVTSTIGNSNKEQDDNYDGPHVIQFPLCVQDISKELIAPFVMREKGLNKIPDMPTTVNMPQTTSSFSFLFNYHKHPLSLVSESHEDEEDHNRIMDDEDEEATNDELKICDVCVTPISSPPYYECAPCKYFVHSICYLLPKTLSTAYASPDIYGYCLKTQNKNHKFTLYTSSESTDKATLFYVCQLCGIITNGIMYVCEGCNMKIDVKCASLPTTIRHASHPRHKPLIMTRVPLEEGGRRRKCHGCQSSINNIAYCCCSDDCDFALDFKCAMLPPSVTKLEWDKHPLRLSFDASLDHPSDFYCGFCEGELNPKKWMYHCRQCDNSFHLFCLRTASGWYRNIKFGRRFVLDGIHSHPLTFSCVTLKRRCNICLNNVYNFCGLGCASCNYVVCLTCGCKELAKM